jgi:hypothetical protein
MVGTFNPSGIFQRIERAVFWHNSFQQPVRNIFVMVTVTTFGPGPNFTTNVNACQCARKVQWKEEEEQGRSAEEEKS